MGKVEISLDDYVNAPDGSILIKRNGVWVAVSPNELNKDSKNKKQEIEKIAQDVANLSRNIKHFKVYAKSHFMVVFNAFKIAILGGTLDVFDKELLNLDEKVMNNEISVEKAIKMHSFLEGLFNKLYVNNEEVYKEV